MGQKDQVVAAMQKNGGYATFGQLNSLIDFTMWGTKTPQASVRRIVQTNDDFFRLQPGLWALKERREEVLSKFNIQNNDESKQKDFSHSYYQGLLVEIGNMYKFDTCVPGQDKNKKFLERSLGSMVSLKQIHDFTYPEIIKRARTVDIVWFNARKLPHSFFEVEHSTDIQNSLMKYYELQDFAASFNIVAPQHRKAQFSDVIGRSIFTEIRDRVHFRNYEDIAKLHEKLLVTKSLELD